MRRIPFILWTTVSLAIAYALFRFVVSPHAGYFFLFPNAWHLLDPLQLIGGEGPWLGVSIGIHVVLAAVLAWLGVRRARDAGWRPWIGALLLLPVARLFLFTALAVVPSLDHTNALDLPRASWLDRLLPTSRIGSAFASILISLGLVLPLGFLDVHVLENYGLALFIGLPFVLGAVSAYLYSHHRQRTWWQSIRIALLTMSLCLLAIFLFAMEGIICLAMAAPIVYAVAVAGALVGHALAQRGPKGAPAMTMLVLISPVLMAFESNSPSHVPLFKVITSVHIEAPPQEVWNELVAFSRMNEPEEMLFRAGISYPVEARIDGHGVGAVRYCQFNTGPFVEPITVWDEPRLLAFNVVDDPPPMTELSIYDHVDAPHVEGFFRSRNGQFRLEEQNDGSTLLEGTTWYTHSIWPMWYWRLWSDNILHRIHLRVLDHIKNESEVSSAR